MTERKTRLKTKQGSDQDKVGSNTRLEDKDLDGLVPGSPFALSFTLRLCVFAVEQLTLM
jgi:hypothetical protein